MRNYYFSGTAIELEYPEQFVWVMDNNWCKVESSNTTDSIGARITVENPTGEQCVLDYWSETNYLVFLLNDTLKQLFSDNLSPWSVLVEVYGNGVMVGTYTFTVKVYNGKSFPDRTHAAQRVIYWYDQTQLAKMQLFTYEGGTATIGSNTYALTAGIDSLNLYSLDLGDETTINIQSTAINKTTPKVLGDMWFGTTAPTTDYNVTLKKVAVCGDSFNPCILLYNDCDGCMRYIAGKLIKETVNEQGELYTRTNNIYRNTPRKMNTKSSKVLTVAFSDIDALAYADDMLFANDIRMIKWDGTTIPVTIETKKIEIKEMQNDFEIDFLIINEK